MIDMYLDNAATTPLPKEVSDYVISILNNYGNPSSHYSLGDTTRFIIEEARENVAKFINANSNEIIFTSSGSASNALAVNGLCSAINNYIMYYSPISHKSLREFCKNTQYSHKLEVDKNGNIKDFEQELKSFYNHYTPIVCVEMANSEIGTIQNIKCLVSLVHRYNGLIIVDFTGYIPSYKVDVKELDVDVATFSGHKLGALKGVGVLYKRDNLEMKPLIYGSQEQGLFAGTENVIGIASIGKAVEIYDYSSVTSQNRDYVYNKLIQEISNCYLVGSIENRLPHNLYMCFQGVKASQLVALLDMNDIQVSTGSACSSGDVVPSATLVEIGFNMEDINSCIRMSFSGKETKDDLDFLCKKLKENVEILRNL